MARYLCRILHEYEQIEAWRQRPLEGQYSYVYLDGLYLKRKWGGQYGKVAVLVAMAVNERGEREVLGAAEGMKEDKESWLSFLRHLKEKKLFEAAGKVEQTGPETLIYMDFSREHWRRIRSNNAMERLNQEIRRRTRSVGAFPDGQSALMLVCARLRQIEESDWGQKTYLNMQHLEELLPSDS